MSAGSAVVALGLAPLLASRLVGKDAAAAHVAPNALRVIGLAFCAFSIYSFLIVPVDQQDFFKLFANGARFETLLIGLAALVMATRALADRRVHANDLTGQRP